MSEERLRHQLEVQSVQIEEVFTKHRIPSRVEGGTVNSRSIRFDLQTSLVSGLERLRGVKQDLMMALGVNNVAIREEDGRLQVEVPQDGNRPVELLPLIELLPQLDPVTAVLGLTEDERPLLLDLTAEDVAHVLIAGDASAGKTMLLRALALSLALGNKQSQLQLVVIDQLDSDGEAPEKGELYPLEFLPHLVTPLVKRLEDAVDALNFLVGEMNYRREQKITTPAIVVLVDEVADLLTIGGQPVTLPLKQLAQQGAKAGIHLALTTENPAATQLDNLLKANLPVRLVGHLQEERLARAAGVTDGQAGYLMGEGDFLVVAGGSATRFQAAYVGDYDFHLGLDRIYDRMKQKLVAQPFNVRPHLAEPAGSDTESLRSFAFNDADGELAFGSVGEEKLVGDGETGRFLT